MADTDGILLEINRSIERASGYPRAELVGSSWLDRFVPERERPRARTLFAGPEARDVEGVALAFRARSGEERRILWSSHVSRDGAGGTAVLLVGQDVTARLLVGPDDGEALFREVQQLAKLGSWELDLGTNSLHWSDEIFSIFELDPARFGASYEAFLAAIHPEDREKVDATYRTSVAQRTSYEIVHRLRMPDGRIKWVQERGRTHYDREGRPVRSMGTVQDISGQMEARLRLRNILDGMQAFVGLCDLEGHLVEINRAPLDVIGLRREDLLGRVVWDSELLRHQREAVREGWRRAAQGESERLDLVAQLAPGKEMVLDAMFTPLRDAHGKIEGVIASAIDVTERRHAEQAAELKTAAIEVSLSAIGFADLAGRLTYANASFLSLWGFREAGEALGRDVSSLWENPSEAAAITRGVVQHGAWKGELTAVRKDGAKRRLLVTANLVRDAAGQPSVLMGSFMDLTDRVEAERKVHAHLKEKETLLREIHHRVKNNLQVISGLLYFQGKKLRAPEDAAVLEELRQRVFALALVHERLYQSSDVAHIDLGEYLRTLVGELRRSYERRSNIEVVVAGDAPALELELAQPVGLIVCELVTNSIKYAFPDGRAGKVRVHISSQGQQVVLDVDDNGVGFPPGFSPASRSSFGWELVRMLVGQLSGKLELTSAGGAHVRITFPVPAVQPPGEGSPS